MCSICGLAELFQSANHSKDWFRKSQIRKVSLLRKARKSTVTNNWSPQISGFAIS